jgi:hypothetical protein
MNVICALAQNYTKNKKEIIELLKDAEAYA